MPMVEVTTPLQGELDEPRKACYMADAGSYTVDGSGNLTNDPIAFTMNGGTINRSWPVWDGSTGVIAKELS